MVPLSHGGNQTYSESGTGKSWFCRILPYIDQEGAYKLIAFGQPVTYTLDSNADGKNELDNPAVAATALPVLLCPTDSPEPLMSGRANTTGTVKYAVNNYKSVAGGNWNWGDYTAKSQGGMKWRNDPNGLDRGTGLICRNSDSQPRNLTTFSDVKDGLSTTFALGEAVPRWSTHTWWFWFNASTATCGIPLNYKKNTGNLESLAGDWANNYSFFSQHTGGANFALCDGSVAFISDVIDYDNVYRPLASISGQEIAQVPAF
jgi:prepilin-type processing-associated H-X9-DG protein